MSLVKREAAQVVDEVSIKRRAVLIELFDKLRHAQAQRVTRFGLHWREKTPKTIGDVFVNLQSDVSVDADEFRTHRVVIRMQLRVQRLDPVHRHTVRTQHAFDLLEHFILLVKTDVPEDVEADNVIERRGWEGEISQHAHTRRVVTIATRHIDQLRREIDAREVNVFAFE